MRNILYLSIILIVILLGCNASKNENKASDNRIAIDSVFDAFSEEQLALYPILATKSGDLRYNNTLANHLSKEYADSLLAFYTSYKSLLGKYDKSKLSKSQQVGYEVLKWTCDINLEVLNLESGLALIYNGKSFSFANMPINQFWSTNLLMGQLAGGRSMQPFKTIKDYENWIKRVDDFMEWCDTAMENMKKGIASGVVLPKSLIKKVIPQIAGFSQGPASEHVFYKPIFALPDDFSDKDSVRLAKAYTQMIEDKLIPKFKELHKFISTDYLEAGRESSGFSDLPNGKKAYNFLIKYFTTTDMTADEIFKIGEQEVERISSEMEEIKKQVGFEGDLKSFFEYIRTNKELMPFNKPEQVIDNFNAIYTKIKPNLALLFKNVPKTPFEIRRIEAFREKSASAHYFPGSKDGSRPGVFYVPIPDVASYNVFSDEDLFLHEAIPGHHYQISLQQENKELPGFLRLLWLSAYGEGWALYTESLGEELGLYENPYQHFGMLSAELHRAIRLVVDVGIHAKGWTREEAIKYSLEHEAKSASAIESEIERYMALPGQALSYKVGQLKILELRSKAEKSLGEKFDIKEFHSEILESGCIPLKLLEKKIDRWVVEMTAID